jgi:hypothetical protein
MLLRDPYADYPSSWGFFNQYAPHMGAEAFGFSVPIDDVNRFAARYRAARCFRTVQFEGFGTGTADGYSALVHVLLTYSAFEHFIRCVGLNLRGALTLLRDGEQTKILERVRRLQGQAEFFAAIRAHVDERCHHHIDAHLLEQDCNPFFLAASIRHAFAHGKLAANPTGVPSSTVGTVCRYLCRLLITIMDRDFKNRMDEVAYELGYTNG